MRFLILALLFLPFTLHAEPAKTETAIFAGGCFWSMEYDMDHVPGVIKTTAGYTGGHVLNPTYEEVSNGDTGHYEAVAVTFNPDKVSYEKLLDVFWHSIDPTDAEGQFCDKGTEYRTAIFYDGKAQKAAAEASKLALEKSGRFKHIATQILPAKSFYTAEDYHQDYYDKNPVRYQYYRFQCGRDAKVKELWK